MWVNLAARAEDPDGNQILIPEKEFEKELMVRYKDLRLYEQKTNGSEVWGGGQHNYEP